MSERSDLQSAVLYSAVRRLDSGVGIRVFSYQTPDARKGSYKWEAKNGLASAYLYAIKRVTVCERRWDVLATTFASSYFSETERGKLAAPSRKYSGTQHLADASPMPRSKHSKLLAMPEVEIW